MGPPSYTRSVANRNVVMHRIPVLRLPASLSATQHQQATSSTPAVPPTGHTDSTLPFLSVRHATERGEPITSPQPQEIYVTAPR
jgi:hypothetical protein